VVTATGIGSMPGADQHAYDEALRTVLGELGEAPGMPHLPEVPGRGAVASMTGRGLALVAELGADLQPAGWRLTGGGAGVDHRRARSLLAQDLDALEERAQGLRGAFKVQLAGPWTLASTVERPRGDRVLGDHGARRELAQALAEGVGAHVADVRRRLPGVDRLVVQVDEPVLGAVLGGRVPTASGLHRHRSVDRPEASQALEWVLDAVTAAGAEAWVHSCAAETPWPLVRGAGARGLLADHAQLSAADHDALAEAVEAGAHVGLGVLPAVDAGTTPVGGGAAERSTGPATDGATDGSRAAGTPDAPATETVLRWLDMLGLDPAEVGDRLVVTPACGLAGASVAWARTALTTVRRVATNLS
jgi:methionine synthase II (cobalamin-independent)